MGMGIGGGRVKWASGMGDGRVGWASLVVGGEKCEMTGEFRRFERF